MDLALCATTEETDRYVLICGYVTNKEALDPILIEAAERLTYRSYEEEFVETLANI